MSRKPWSPVRLSSPWRPGCARRAMTLVELLIVLGLMAALASVALTTLDSMGDRTRADTTRNRLDAIERAVLGDEGGTSRFLNDMGRLPVDLSSDGADPLSELWQPGVPGDDAADDADYACRAVTLDDWKGDQAGDSWFPGIDLSLECGWRGPYLRVHGTHLYDGFGNAFTVTEAVSDNETETSLFYGLPDAWIVEIAGLGRSGEEDDPDEEDADWENQDDVRTILPDQVLATLHVRILVRDCLISGPSGSSASDQRSWISPGYGTSIARTIEDRKTSEVYHTDQVVRAAGSGNYPATETDKYHQDDLFVCVTGGTSGTATNETLGWDRNGVVTDNSVEWRYLPYSCRMNRMRVALFAPYVAGPDLGAERVEIRRITASYDHHDSSPSAPTLALVDRTETRTTLPDTETLGVAADWDEMGNVTFTGLTPGVRKLFVYGATLVGSNRTNGYSSGLQTIELKPGANYITVYLNQPLEQ